MTPIILVLLVVALWAGAATLWILDTPAPRQTVDVLLATPETVREYSKPTLMAA